VKRKLVDPIWVKTSYNVADALTKPLAAAIFKGHRASMGLV